MDDDVKEVFDEISQTDEGGDGECLGESGATAAAVLKTENWMAELSKAVDKPCVICVVRDETSSKWRRSRYCYSLPLSSSVADLYSTIAKEAGMHAACMFLRHQMVCHKKLNHTGLG